jgi:hypothetical protein
MARSVSTVSLVAVPLRPLLLQLPLSFRFSFTLAITKPSRGRSQGVKECTLYGFAAGFTKLSITR